MKNFIFYGVLFLGYTVFSQGGGIPVYNNPAGASDAEYNSLTGNPNEWSKISGVFYEFDDITLEKAGIDGSNYLFDEWDNDGLIVAGQKKYRINNINYNVRLQRFESRLDGDSLFMYDLHSLSKLYVNGKEFKSLYDNSENLNIIYEVLYTDNDMALLKTYEINVIQGSPNPMLNRKTTKIRKKESYFVQQGESLQRVKLKKAEILKLVANDKRSDVEQFAKQNKLSFKNAEDVTRMLKYASSNL